MFCQNGLSANKKTNGIETGDASIYEYGLNFNF